MCIRDRNPLKTVEVTLSRAIQQAVAVVEPTPNNVHRHCLGRLKRGSSSHNPLPLLAAMLGDKFGAVINRFSNSTTTTMMMIMMTVMIGA